MAPTVVGVRFRIFWRSLREFRTLGNRNNYFTCSVTCSIKESHNFASKTWPTRHRLAWNYRSGTLSSQFATKRLASFIPSKNEPTIHELPDVVDPFAIAKENLVNSSQDILKELNAYQPELKDLSEYYFDGRGKSIRPAIVVLMARALNNNTKKCKSILLPAQRQIALITEMIHTATLVHDDVIDISHTRRGKASANMIWGQRKSILAGDYIVSSAAGMIARIGNDDVTALFAEILLDLVQGELMQLGAKEREDDRFSHYILRNFKKTGSLIANSCKAVALLGNNDAKGQELAYLYGRNIGIAFQLIDDVLDFESTSTVLGKPAIMDLRLGLATAPVLFACEKFPELNSMIMRRFNHPGDVEKALDSVLKSDGIQETRLMAERHCAEGVKLIQQLSDSVEKKALIAISDLVLNRVK